MRPPVRSCRQDGCPAPRRGYASISARWSAPNPGSSAARAIGCANDGRSRTRPGALIQVEELVDDHRLRNALPARDLVGELGARPRPGAASASGGPPAGACSATGCATTASATRSRRPPTPRHGHARPGCTPGRRGNAGSGRSRPRRDRSRARRARPGSRDDDRASPRRRGDVHRARIHLPVVRASQRAVAAADAVDAVVRQQAIPNPHALGPRLECRVVRVDVGECQRLDVRLSLRPVRRTARGSSGASPFRPKRSLHWSRSSAAGARTRSH